MTDRFDDLIQRVIDDRLTPAEWADAERSMLADPILRRRYVDAVSLQAALPELLSQPNVRSSTIVRSRSTSKRILATFAALAASLLVVLGWWQFSSGSKPIAELVETKSCRWDSGTLPTAAGSRLEKGRLRLAEGLARVVFSSGADLTIEGPADLELLSPMACILHRGQLSAKIPPTAHGFVVETPTSVLTDLGTEFGVKVHDGNSADVQVFSGLVDVMHRKSGKTSSLRTGNAHRFLTEQSQSIITPELPKSTVAEITPPSTTKTIHVSTAMGTGRDAFVMAMETIPDDRQSETLLLVKKNKNAMKRWDRMAYLAFDPALIPNQPLLDSELSVTFAPTGMGYASLVPDATFTVYGIRGAVEPWTERDIDWATAPANIAGEGLDQSRLVQLGTFVVSQGVQTGTFTLGGPALTKFLIDQRPHASMTMIVTRDTIGRDGMDLVHGIASRRHPTLRPPTLRLTIPEPTR